MKKIEAIIRSEKLDELREALDAKGLSSMTVTDVRGRGAQKGITLEWRVGEYTVEFLPKIKVEIIVNDQQAETVIKIITGVCQTGNIGDGKIFVLPVEQAVRIRTGERGEQVV
ncbi:transcriptional regulator [candidate division WOR-1 bacterium RIFOXYB2_FULL_48_7]|uniref:Transcriptional regulator n=1 Tax=candidate division WOR-1 bacterium RIFOXYB2_FULL_48_7 TaxID=1802583 RepID=A0A1F4TK31_UNCSA|nr:MAG: transcriptional regulator [candidate division WOR-1 bacterium RIFOXYB2_FULL_48_7]